ncbi:MAG: NADH pyrophosphatase, partial [Chloroflexota bacterium]|nr:NADH pyrophosphatase [Chloroflexota bacterium]
GFTCEYAGGDLRLDEREIADAAWFTRDKMPQIPPKLSIARRLIDSFLEE